MSWQDQLIKLGSEHPNLQKHIRPVLDKTGAGAQRDLQETIQGNKIFTVKRRVGEQAQEVLLENGLYPELGAVLFEDGKAIISVTCKGHDFVDNPTQGDLNYIAKRVKKKVERLGFRVEVDSFLNTKEDVVVDISQRIK